MTTADPYDLSDSLTPGTAGGTYRRAAAELRNGRKDSHWMWFIFRRSPAWATATRRGSTRSPRWPRPGTDLAHPVLGPRLLECAAILTGAAGRTAEQVFGEVDAVKLRSSMTLFMRAAPGEPVFGQVLDQYFDGVPDPDRAAALTRRPLIVVTVRYDRDATPSV